MDKHNLVYGSALKIASKYIINKKPLEFHSKGFLFFSNLGPNQQ